MNSSPHQNGQTDDAGNASSEKSRSKNNWVAKHNYHQSLRFRDRKNDYQRHEKHKKRHHHHDSGAFFYLAV